MTEILEDFEIRVFREDDDGSLVDMQNQYPTDFGYLVPSIGDEIPTLTKWIANGDGPGMNGFMVVKRRIHMFAQNEIVLICTYKQATVHDRDIF